MNKFQVSDVIEKTTAILLGSMFVSMSLAALTIAISAALDVI